MVKLTDITGIGPATIKVLSEHKIKTVEALAAISLIELQKIPGFSGAIRARAVKESAADCLQDKSTKPLAAATGSTQAKIKKAPGKKNLTSQIVDPFEPDKAINERKKNRNDGKPKSKIKDKKKKDRNKTKKKDGKKKGKNKKNHSSLGLIKHRNCAL